MSKKHRKKPKQPGGVDIDIHELFVDAGVVDVGPELSPPKPAMPKKHQRLMRQVDDLQASLRQIRPHVKALQKIWKQQQTARISNNPPGTEIDAMPYGVQQVDSSIDALVLIRNELTKDASDPTTMNVCGEMLERVAEKAKELLAWTQSKAEIFADAFAKKAGESAAEFIFKHLPIAITTYYVISAAVRTTIVQ